jgi:NADH-quinone oxidoreductase subunit K
MNLFNNIFNNLNFIIYFSNTIWFISTLVLFLIGIFGVILSRKNVIILLMSLELLLLALNINFICFSVLLDDLIGELFTFCLLTIGASESAIGLALIVSYYKNYTNKKY